MMLASIPSPPSNVLEVGPLTIHYYGIAIAVGVLVAISVLRRRYEAAGGDPDLADRTALWAVAAGFVGARVGYLLGRVIDGDIERFIERPLSIIAVWEGGLTFFGGLTFGAIGAIWYLRRKGGDLPAFTDAVAPALPLAQAIGRVGNYFNQELYGTPTTLPWGLEIDPQNRVAPYQAFETFHPTFLYEALWNVALAVFIVWLGRRRVIRPGGLIFVYAAGYGVMRFLLELIRTDTDFRILGISRNGYVAMLVFAIGAVGLWAYQRRGGATVPPDEAEDPDLVPLPADPLALDHTDEEPGDPS